MTASIPPSNSNNAELMRIYNPAHWLNYKIHHLSDESINAISGASAGFFAGISVCPLDVAKTRLQAQGVSLQNEVNNNISNSESSPLSSNSSSLSSSSSQNKVTPKYKGMFGTLTIIFKEEGIRGLYRGLVPITIGYLPTWMIYFTIYEKSKTIYPNLFKSYSNSQTLPLILSAITAGLASSVITNPIWVVKTRLMLQTGDGHTTFSKSNGNKSNLKNLKNQSTYYNGTIEAFIKMYKNEGLKVFYAGLLPSMFGLLHVAVHFPLWEKLKIIFKCGPDENVDFKVFRLLAASCISKMTASVITYPHEVLRTRMQIQSIANLHDNNHRVIVASATDTAAVKSASNLPYVSLFTSSKTSQTKSESFTKTPKQLGLIKIATNIYKVEGFKAFYSGLGTNMVRTVPSSAVTLVSFDYMKSYFTHLQDREKDYPLL